MSKGLGLDKWFDGIRKGFHKEVDNEMIKSTIKCIEEVNEIDDDIDNWVHNIWNERPTIDMNNQIFNDKDQSELEDLINDFIERLDSWKKKNEIKYRWVHPYKDTYS